MERSRAVGSQSSTYGQACTQCYKAKCRCVRTGNSEKCDRCLRLKKRCEPSESTRRRNAQTAIAEASDARIARLEEKMESLLSAMQTFIGSPGALESSLNGPQPLGRESLSSFTSCSESTLIDSTSSHKNTSEEPTFALDPTATNSPNALGLFSLSPYAFPAITAHSEADERLNFFRSRMLPSFPFIHLRPEMTSWYLSQNRPFLLQAIHTVTAFSTKERTARVEELKHVLFTSALLKVQSSIDLLLGTLTYLAWSTDAFLGRADLVSRLLMLAISLASDLRLFKPPSLDTRLIMTMTQGHAEDTHADDSETPGDEAPYEPLERKRAALACFILSSNISSHLGRQDSIRWTPHMEEALRLIESSQSCPSDEVFVAQGRLTILRKRADDVRHQEETSCVGTEFAPTAASTPQLLYIKTLRRELHHLKSSFSPTLQQNEILNSHAQYVELHINQLAYSVSLNPPPLALSTRQSNADLIQGFERLSCLWQSVENIKSWLDTFYKIPSYKLIGQPFHFWSQMIMSITLLKYLSTLKDPDWDCQAVKNTVHLISTMDCMLRKFDLCSKEPELRCGDHLLKYLSKLLTRCRGWAEARWNVVSQIPAGEKSPRQGQNGGCATVEQDHRVPDIDQMVWMQTMDLGSEQWFEDVLGMPTTFY